MPDKWTQLALFAGLLLQTLMYLTHIYESDLAEKRDEIVERVEIDKDRIRQAMSTPVYVEGGLGSS